MPIFTDTMDNHSIQGSNYGFSAKRIEELGATEYTLVGIACDASSSVLGFRDDLEACVKEIVKACARSPRSDNLMLRLLQFNRELHEIHGFRPLTECNTDDYTGAIQPRGTTSLYDAACNLTESLALYGTDLAKNDFDANGILFVITDGADNTSTMTAAEVRKSLQRAVQSEALESVVSILIGVNVQDPQLSKILKDFAQDGGFTQYVELEDAKANTLARLADFVSKSISSQSQALGSGGPSQSLNF